MKKQKMQGKFLPPKSDVAFKELMRNETVRRYFISDVLGIPPEEISETRLENTYLGRRGRRDKEGILDVKLLFNNDCRVNIELQIKNIPAWDKRSLFYLSRMYVEGVHAGEDYALLKKCIVICVLGFSWDAYPGYHKVYSLRDQEGRLYSDQFEIHVIELNKELTGHRLDDWVRLFRAEHREDLHMIHSENPGIMEAVKEVMTMNLGARLRALYEEHMRIKRDRIYLRNIAINEGKSIGKAMGMTEGLEQGRAQGLEQGHQQGLEQGLEQGLQQGRQQGLEQGKNIGDLKRRRQDILELLEDLGETPQDILSRIYAEEDTGVLRHWHKAAAKANSYEEFRDAMISHHQL